MQLLADIGGTNTRIASLDAGGNISNIVVQKNDAFDNLKEILIQYVHRNASQNHFVSGALAVAAPVEGDTVHFTNRSWHYSNDELANDLGMSFLKTINDFTANAMSLPFLTGSDVISVGSGHSMPGKPLAIIGPGTGLGVSSLIPDASGQWTAISGEGGHVTLAAGSNLEARIIQTVREEHGHVSAERLLCGSGLTNLYQAICWEKGVKPKLVKPEIVGSLAKQGDLIAQQTIAMFFSLLGSVAGNLALTLGSKGGVYIAGGIVPRFKEDFVVSNFRSRFSDKGRYKHYNDSI
ncbi:MAG: glucokinase, partial [Parasphingorhabdus sp.]